MLLVICLVIMPKECMIEAELQDNRHQGQRNREQRQHAERASRKLARVDWHQYQSKRAVDHAANAEDQRVLNCLFDFVVYRDPVSLLDLKTPERLASLPQPIDSRTLT